MKRIPSFLTIPALAALFATVTLSAADMPGPLSNPVITDKEIILSGPLLGKGEPTSVIILDRESGLYQAGLRDLDTGEITWQETRSTGLPAIDDAAITKLNERAPMTLTVTHADSNQISIFMPHGNRVETHPERIVSPVARPGFLAAGRFALTGLGETQQYTDLAFLSDFRLEKKGQKVTTLQYTEGLDVPKVFGQDFWPANPGGRPHQLTTSFAGFEDGIDVPVLAKTHQPEHGDAQTRLTIIQQGGERGDLNFIQSDSFGQSQQSFLSIPFLNQEAQFDSMHISWNTDEAVLYGFFPSVREQDQLQECSLGDDYRFGFSRVVLLEDGLQQFARILIISNDGAFATIHEHNGVYCWGGSEFNMEAEDKENLFLGAVPNGEGGFTLLTGPMDGRITGWQSFERDGDDYDSVAQGAIPEWEAQLRFANLFAYQSNPFLNPGTPALDAYRFLDWTLGAEAKGDDLIATGLGFSGGEVGAGGKPVTEPIAPSRDGAFYLPNQIADNISVSSIVPIGSQTNETISVAPLPGRFDRSITLSFSTSLAGAEVYYQLNPDQPWRQVSEDGPPVLYQNTTLRFFAQNEDSLTATQSAEYTFTRDFHEFDSNRDGIPDFVRDFFGLDPHGPPDTTGNGVTDLEEILSGFDPLNPSDAPDSESRLALGGRFNAEVFVSVQDLEELPEISFISADRGETVRAADTAGTLLGSGRIEEDFTGGIDDTRGARITGLEPNPSRPYLSFRTNRLFSDEAENLIPEMVSLVPTPSLALPEISYSPSGGDLETEVANWVEAARDAYLNLETETVESQLSPHTTLQTALFERHLAVLWETAADLPETPALTLFPQRTGDGNRASLGRDEWRLLSRPQSHNGSPDISLPDLSAGWQNLNNFLDGPEGTNARTFAEDLFQVHQEFFLPGESSARPPLDAFRYFLETEGSLPEFYGEETVLTEQELSDLYEQLKALVGDLSPTRPLMTVLAEIKSDTFTNRCRVVGEADSSKSYLLLNSRGEAYRFSSGLRLPEGTLLSITGFTDAEPVDLTCVSESMPLEVLSVDLAVLPTPLDEDGSGNLLPESWEELHFGSTGQNPFADASGNGYSNLEHYLRGRGPFATGALTSEDPVDFSPPSVRIKQGDNGNFEIEWEYGADLADYFQFRFEKSTDLVNWTEFEPEDSQHDSQGEFKAEVPPAEDDNGERTFYRFHVELRED